MAKLVLITEWPARSWRLLEGTQMEWPEGIIRPKLRDLRRARAPEVLIALFAEYRLWDNMFDASVRGRPFLLRGTRGTLAGRVRDLIENANKSRGYWINSLFGRSRSDPRKCRLAELFHIEEQKYREDFEVLSPQDQLAPYEVFIKNCQEPIDTADQLCRLLIECGFRSDPDVESPATEPSKPRELSRTIRIVVEMVHDGRRCEVAFSSDATVGSVVQRMLKEFRLYQNAIFGDNLGLQQRWVLVHVSAQEDFAQLTEHEKRSVFAITRVVGQVRTASEANTTLAQLHVAEGNMFRLVPVEIGTWWQVMDTHTWHPNRSTDMSMPRVQDNNRRPPAAGLESR